MKLYTGPELDLLIENATTKEDLSRISSHVHENKERYGHLYVYTQMRCVERLKSGFNKPNK